MGDDQRMLGIDCGLHVVGWGIGPGHRHEARLRFAMPLQLLQRNLHSGGIDSSQLLFVGLFHAVQIALQRLPLTHTVGAGDGAELGVIEGNPLPANQAAALRKPY